MAIFAQPQEYPVEAWLSGCKEASKRLFIMARSRLGFFEIGPGEMEVLLRHGYMDQHRFPYQSIIAIGVVPRYVTLIGQEEVHVGPGNFLSELSSKQLVKEAGCSSSREGDTETMMLGNEAIRRVDKGFGHRSAQALFVGKDP